MAKIERPSADFGRHHFTPRKTWAEELGHFDKDKKEVTDNGKNFLSNTGWDGSRASEHWISPSDDCRMFLRTPTGGALIGFKSPTLDLLRPQAEEVQPTKQLIEDAANFLRSVFDHIKLDHARQALTAPLTYFLLNKEIMDGKRYNIDNLLESIARTHRSEIAFFSSRSGKLAYYQLRKSNKM